MMETPGNDVSAISTAQQWVAKFKRDRQSPEDDPRHGRPTTVTMQENIDQVHQLVIADIDHLSDSHQCGDLPLESCAHSTQRARNDEGFSEMGITAFDA